jgi:uncharacterized protein YjiK
MTSATAVTLSAALFLLSVACGPRSEAAVRADSLSTAPKAASAPSNAATGSVDSSLPAPGPRGVLGRYDLAGEPSWQVRLPKDLNEISGLAFSGDGRLFAHGDQDATIWQLDAAHGKVLKTFTVAAGDHDPDLGKKRGKGTLAGDFEDIQIVGNRFFLISSNGVLIEFREGAGGASVPYTAHDTGLGKTCEIEGLTYDPASRALLILCKIPHTEAYRKQVVLFAWPLDRGATDTTPRIRVDYDRLAGTGSSSFHGSAVALAPGGQSLVLVAGPQEAFAELSLTGEVLSSGGLDRKAHRQPEGLAFAPDGTLLVSDEGGGKRATLSGYAPKR